VGLRALKQPGAESTNRAPSQMPWGHGEAKRESVPSRVPNTYEDPGCQETNSS